MSFIPDHVYELCQGQDTVTTALAASPTSTVDAIADKLYKDVKMEKSKVKIGEPKLMTNDLDRAASCGQFTSRPSDLFLQVCYALLFFRSIANQA